MSSTRSGHDGWHVMTVLELSAWEISIFRGGSGAEPCKKDRVDQLFSDVVPPRRGLNLARCCAVHGNDERRSPATSPTRRALDRPRHQKPCALRPHTDLGGANLAVENFKARYTWAVTGCQPLSSDTISPQSGQTMRGPPSGARGNRRHLD